MSLVELFILAVGLSMDAFAVSICKGLSLGKITKKHFCFAVTVRFYLTRRIRKCVTVKTEFGKAFIITIVWRILSIPRIWQER